MADDLKKARLQWVRRELDQVGMAMSLVGTRRPMLLKMARYLEPIIDGLHGERPEIRKIRQGLVRAKYNLERGPTTPLRSSRNMWIARDLLDEVLKLKDKGLLGVPDFYEGRLGLENFWGYTSDELKDFQGLLDKVIKELDNIGLSDELVYGAVVLSPESTKGQFFSYDERTGFFFADPSRGKSKADIYAAFGDRIWDRLFISADRQAWPSRGQFVSSFAKAIRGQQLDSETMARLQVTVGRVAGDDWQNMTA